MDIGFGNSSRNERNVYPWAKRNDERNGQLAEEIADAQANNEHMEADYDVEPIGQLDEEIMEPRIIMHNWDQAESGCTLGCRRRTAWA